MAGNRKRGSLCQTCANPGKPLESKAGSDEKFLIACADNRNPFFYLFNVGRYGRCAQMAAPGEVFAQMNNTTSWQQRLSLFSMQALCFLKCPMAIVGRVVELVGNIIIVNGGLLIVPAQDSVEYKTLIGMLDPRTALMVVNTNATASGQTHDNDSGNTSTKNAVIFSGSDSYGGRRISDVMLMAAKLAYENEALVKKVVTESWTVPIPKALNTFAPPTSGSTTAAFSSIKSTMNFVGYYNCWNEFQQRWNKQVFIFTDKKEDANAVVVAWRGTEPFNAYDWSTNFDFSWYDLKEGMGKVHVGYLEALGLGNRNDMTTFTQLRRNASVRKQNKVCLAEFHEKLTDNLLPLVASRLPQTLIDAPDKFLAYDHVTQIVKELLKKNPNAKLFFTGHSLGGALAMLFPGMWFYFGENTLTEKIAAVYTFGQPRVGDEQFCKFMHERLSAERYYRVVYCNDIVPRVLFDDPLFQFRHWGFCFFFHSLTYEEQTLEEEPNRNYFRISDFFSVHLNAVWELLNSLFMRYEHGPEYKESTTSLLFRVLALLLPGLGDHSPVNYVNAVRLGKPMPLVAKLS